jgi:hypothetical protein
MVYWNEMSKEDSLPIIASCSEEEAIQRQKESAKKNNYTYTSDKHALEDFMCIHWAWKA